MKNKIVIFNIVIVTLALLIVFFSGISLIKKSHLEEAEKQVVTVTDVYAANYSDNITATAPKDIRITVIDANKKVIADSQDSAIVGKPHENREEITAAWEDSPKVVTRKSESLGADMVYYAKKVTVGDTFVIVRAAIKVETVNQYVFNALPTYVYVLISVLFVSYIAGILATVNLIKPLEEVKNTLAAVNNGEKINRSYDNESDSDVREMLGEIADVSEKLQNSINEANTERERLDYVLANVSDGITVIDAGGIVTVMNKVACGVFGGDGFIGRKYTALTADEKFLSEIGETVALRETRSFEYENAGNIYMVIARALENSFTVIVLTDITQIRNGEKMREEFFANASHELKTPLTAIKGFNDLIALKTSDEEIKSFTAKSDKEITRLVSLIGDMLDLSKLENSGKIADAEELDLGKIATEVAESLAPLAANKKISVSVSGNGIVRMEREHAVELVKNLVENAIRYNNENGKVEVSVLNDGGNVVLRVKDNGIGIEEEHLGRIFERFYRVNKSRSRETGGTGLGLSIVKHVCALYNAEPVVHSRYGEGTIVEVKFK
ncbi:MAG: ATP-binding protein [Candidatus Borkfalkiaceae bacterium]|nr:ATP-binding protein [Christensenellaceae bacterium]MDY3724876.1 ATP-binding protein [Christensenellaceae bacterium]